MSNLDFPADLFYNILYHAKDLTWLWTDCREVSSDFKKAVERVFITRHLRKTRLLIDGGMIYSEQHGKVFLDCEFEFSHLDPDPLRSRVTFVDKQCADVFKKKLSRRLKSIFEYGNLVHDPKIIVQVRRDANDTQIPEMQADWDKLEISFDWKAMYNAYFREDKEYHRRLGVYVANQKETVLKMREQVSTGELDEMDSFKRVFDMFADSYHETRKQVRRDRIRHEVWEKDQVVWKWLDDDDSQALKKLKDTRFVLGWGEPFSDESDGEDRDQGDGDEIENEDDDEDDDEGEDEDEEDEDDDGDEEDEEGEEDEDDEELQ